MADIASKLNPLFVGAVTDADRVARPGGGTVETALAAVTAVETIGRSVLSPAAASAQVGTYVFVRPTGHDALTARFRTRNVTPVAIVVYVRPYTVSGLTATPVASTSWVAVSIPAGPIDFEAEAPFLLLAGQNLGVSGEASRLSYIDGPSDSGGYLRSATPMADAFTATALATTTQLQVGMDVTYLAATPAKVAALDAQDATNAAAARTAQDTANAAVSTVAQITSRQLVAAGTARAHNGAIFAPAASDPTFYEFAVGLKNGTTVLDGVPLDAVPLVLQYPTAAARVEAMLMSRPRDATFIDGLPENAGDTACWTAWQSVDVTNLGFGAGVVGAYTWLSPTGQSPQTAGKSFYIRLRAFDANGARVPIGCGRADPTGLSQLERGWFRSTTAAIGGGASWQAIGATGALAGAAQSYKTVVTGLAPARVDLLAAAYFTATVSGFTVAVTGQYHRNGTDTPVTASPTLVAAATGKERIDQIVMDRTSLAVSVVAGAERDLNLDAIEWQGALPAGAVLIARALVGPSDVKAVVTSDFRGLIRVGGEGEASTLVDRNRGLFLPVLAMAMRGSAIKWLGDGDSQCAMQDSREKPAALADQYTPNGAWRDRRNYYFISYPADTLALIPTFDFGDGKVDHIKLGENWAIKAALDRIAGSAVVNYLNAAIGSATTANTLVNGIPNLLYPARLAAALALLPDVAALMGGMNDRPTPTITYANAKAWALAHWNNGAKAVIIYGCPRPNKNQSVADWRTVNRGLESAAFETGSIWIPTTTMSDDYNLGGIGVPAETLASTNELTGGFNHRGLFEIRRYEANARMYLGLPA